MLQHSLNPSKMLTFWRARSKKFFNLILLFFYQETPVDAEGKNGVTPLHVAVHYDNTSLALLLLEKASFPSAHAFLECKKSIFHIFLCFNK
jgi:hypothetical protein